MGRKKSNKKKGQGAAKTAEKTAKAEKKALKKELGEDDIDTLLADLRVRDAAQSAISIAPCDAPSPRSGATWIAHPTKPELILFGGELYDGRTTSVYNDLLIFNLQKKEWRKVSSATCPPPRSAHQAVVVDRAEAPEMWIFGGEFTSPSGNQFHHYRDLWKLDLNTFAWELKAGGEKSSGKKGSSSSSSAGAGPSARSGHRMVLYKHKILVFGGFYDSGFETKYFGDLHAFDLEQMAWLPAIVPTSALAPQPRSGFGFFCNEAADTAYVMGGVALESKAKPKEAAASKGAKKSSKSAGQSVQVPVTYSDLWAINLNNSSWSQVKKRGYFPATGRFAMGVAVQKEKQRCFLFGGVKDADSGSGPSSSKGGKGRKDGDSDSDDELGGDGESTNFNDLYAFDMRKEAQRFFFVDYKGDAADKSHAYEISVKVKAKGKDEGKAEEGAEAGAAAADADENSVFDFDPAAAAAASAAPAASSSSSSSSSSSLSLHASASAPVPVPAPRRSSLLCMKGGICYLFGGVQEQGGGGDCERTFGDVWSIEVGKGAPQWELLVAPKDEVAWAGSDAEDEGEDSDSDSDADERKGKGKGKKKSKAAKKADSDDEQSDDEDSENDSDDSSDDDEEEQKQSSSSSSSSSSGAASLQPATGESLTVFFARTKAHWMAAAVGALVEDKRLAAEAAARAEQEAREAAEEEAKAKAKQMEELGADAHTDDAAGVDDEDNAAAAAADSSSKSKGKDKDKEKEKKSKKSSKDKESGSSSKSAKGGSSAASSSSADGAAAAYDKELRTKAFQLASTRFQQR